MGRFVQAAAAAAALVLASAGIAAAQEVRSLEAGAAPAAATLADMKGLLGDWAGKGAAAGFSAPAAGEIVGHLLLYTDAGPRVQELWILRPEGGSVLVRQKHTTPDLKDREDKDAWGQRRLVAHDAEHLYFENLTWVTHGDSLDLLVRIPGQNGAPPTMLSYNLKRTR